MAEKEKTGFRNQSYSQWHRTSSISRFIDYDLAYQCSQIDLDVILYVEYNRKSRHPIGYIEVAVDVGQKNKTSYVTRNVAKVSGLPAMVVLYSLSDTDIPGADGVKDIESFRVKKIYPEDDNKWYRLSPEKYAELILRFREFGQEMLTKRLTDLESQKS